MWTNYHTHSNFCDGKENPEKYIDRAIQLKMPAIGFSSHAPLPFDCLWSMPSESLDDYLDFITQSRARYPDIEIYKGLEVDYIPGTISPADFTSQLDYTIGSVHFVEQFNNGIGWEIDGLHITFRQGLEEIFDNNIQDAVVRYQELTREMIITSSPTILGHLDKIKIQNIGGKLFHEDDTWYKDEIKKTLDVVAKSNTIIEVNTRGIYQKKTSATYPSPWILELIRQRHIPITLSSDAHHPDDLISNFPMIVTTLQSIGFETLQILHHHEWQSVKLNDQGIILT
jgi:histidinol-phosphatase (PHP family)